MARIKHTREVHAEQRRCRQCGCTYIFRVLEDGTRINDPCPRCTGTHVHTIKVYPRGSA